MLGTFDSCRLEVLEDRCICSEDVMFSDSALLESLIAWNFDSWATVLLVAESPRLAGSKLLSVFLLSKALRNAEI